MRRQRRDVVRDDLVRQIHLVAVRHLVAIYMGQNLADVNLVHLVQDQIVQGDLVHVDPFFDPVAVGVQQNLDEQILDVVQTLVRVVDQLDAEVLDHQKFQMDYFRAVVVRDVVVRAVVVGGLVVKVWEQMVLVLQKFQMDYCHRGLPVVLVELELQ